MMHVTTSPNSSRIDTPRGPYYRGLDFRGSASRDVPLPNLPACGSTSHRLTLNTLAWDWVAIADVTPADADCLHAWERERYHGFRSPQRRATFLAGRLAAKRLLLSTACAGADMRELVILSWNRDGRGVSPRVWLRRRLIAGQLSISHDDWQAVAVWTTPYEAPVGIDVSTTRHSGSDSCLDNARTANFTASPLWFGTDELRRLRELGAPTAGMHDADGTAWATARDWFSLKEAAFKVSAETSFQPLRFRLATNGKRKGDSPHHDFETHLESRSLATRCRLALARRSRPFRPADHTPHYSLAPPELQHYS
ncbi:hypothetical protein SH139x_000370 [Planctomycetaceae bacterium SH139]